MNTPELDTLLKTDVNESVGRFRHGLKYSLQLIRHCARALRHDHADQMAAALTYRTIFSLIPMFVLALIVFKAFGGFEKAGNQVQNTIMQWAGLTSLSYDQAVDGKQQQARTAIETKMTELQDSVNKLDFGKIGAIGTVLFIWAAIALVVAMEASFNEVYSAPRGRPWHMRITIYWAAITLGPVLLFVSLYLAGKLATISKDWGGTPAMRHDGTYAHGPLLAYLGLVLGWFLTQLSHLTALLASWLLLFLLYRLLPNTRVQSRAAMIGSLVAAVMWEIGKQLFSIYVKVAVPYSAVYGAMGLIPLFLFWVYVTWLIVLFGLEISYTLQTFKTGSIKFANEHHDSAFFHDPRLLIPMMALTAKAFAQGRTTTTDSLSRELSLPPRVITYFGERLEKAGFIHRTVMKSDLDPAFALARSPEQIQLADLVALSRTIAGEATLEQQTEMQRTAIPGVPFLDKLAAAQQTAAQGATLASLLE